MRGWDVVIGALRSEGATPRVYAELMAHLRPRAVSAARRWRWGVPTALCVEDVAQEMAVATWRAVDAYEGDAAGLEKAAAVAARSAARDALRRASGWPDPRRRQTASVSSLADADAFATPELDIDAAVALRRALADLPLEIRDAVVVAMEGNGVSAAARRLDSGNEWSRRVRVTAALERVAAAAA